MKLLVFLPDLEWKLSVVGAVKTELEEPPKKSITDVMDRAMKQSAIDGDSDDDNDWWLFMDLRKPKMN